MKKKFAVFMALVMAVGISLPVYAVVDNSTSSSEINSKIIADGSASLNLSLEDALKRVETSYNQILLDDRYIEILDRQYHQAMAYKDSGSNSLEEDGEKTLKLNVPVALYNLNNKKHEREVNLKTAKVTITNEYQNILAAQQNIDYINEEISKLQKEMNSINAKINVGLAKASDIEQFKATMATYEANLSSAQSKMKSSVISLKNDLGIDLNTEIVLTSKPIEYVKFNDSLIYKRIQTAIENSYNIKALKQEIENTEIEYNIYDRFSNANKDSTEIKLEGLKNQLEQMPNSIEVRLRTQYNTLKSLENGIEADKLNIEAAEINLEIAQENYNLGQITYLDLLSAELQLSKAKNTLQQDIISYMAAVATLENSLELQ
ncbi:TolC family protein [Clostridium malenominatum]|uniref:TolC family protein n=1 Tax=Clostridium malenominatum TaxID=1539 RepID=A0ABN1J2Q7_9CLOT